MKKTLTTAVAALVACAGPQVFAQNLKEGAITFALTSVAQSSVSTSPSTANAGNWSSLPPYYKTTSKKLSQTDIIRSIAYVLYGNAGAFSSKAQLVLVQGELGGFFNLTPELADATSTGAGTFGATSFGLSQEGLSVRLATGRHLQANPINGAWPVGHHQPWGQIFVKDAGRSFLVCTNVTYFFSLTVQECYDCFYLNSFVTDTKFTFKAGTSSGPPCCSTPENLTGSGKDQYYLTLSFDNSYNNPYLNPNSTVYVDVDGIGATGLNTLVADGLTPDFLPYSDAIRSGLGNPSPYVMRFTLNGLVNYSWSLKFINSSDISPDFIGTAKYTANGYGFVGLYCSLLSGTATITEKAIAASTCCGDYTWYDSWYGTGFNASQDPWTTYFPTPVNAPADLSLHFGFDQSYDPATQNWTTGIHPQPTAPVPTIDTNNPSVFIPVSGRLGL